MYRKTSYGRSNYGRSSFSGPRFSSKPAPVEADKEYDVTVTETSRRGDGVAKIDGFVIFVANAKPGQKAKVKITNVAPRFANAEIVEPTEENSSQDTPSPQEASQDTTVSEES